jgi:hypothetical protein
MRARGSRHLTAFYVYHERNKFNKIQAWRSPFINHEPSDHYAEVGGGAQVPVTNLIHRRLSQIPALGHPLICIVFGFRGTFHQVARVTTFHQAFQGTVRFQNARHQSLTFIFPLIQTNGADADGSVYYK